jgi:hypothetical protein
MTIVFNVYDKEELERVLDRMRKAFSTYLPRELPLRIEWGTEQGNKQDELIVIYVRKFLEDIKKEPNLMFQMGLAMRLIHDLTTEIK